MGEKKHTLHMHKKSNQGASCTQLNIVYLHLVELYVASRLPSYCSTRCLTICNHRHVIVKSQSRRNAGMLLLMRQIAINLRLWKPISLWETSRLETRASKTPQSNL